MFKYLWIVILVLIVGCFIVYTAVCMYKSLMEALDYFDRRDMKDVSIFEIISRTWEEFTCWYDTLCAVWFGIMIVTIVVLFVTSLACYIPELPAE